MRCGRQGGCAEAENNRASLAFELPRKELPRAHLSARAQAPFLIFLEVRAKGDGHISQTPLRASYSFFISYYAGKHLVVPAVAWTYFKFEHK
ncbi:hypothetical protein CEXT_273881 [Caerostris extrusa]|uniref:Uncharacterized protein n=1 Tax=Caerostris extrusa TaxID=172846 RepID=A0AAV4NS31_CAEEX|nr:hypothetical protein CEXT_273881 [Caerostris extrusa]